MTPYHGLVVLLGSGETSPSIRKVYDDLFQNVQAPVNVSILETPAGFEPNSDYVAGQIGAYLEKHLQNHRPAISIIPARKRGTTFSPDDPDLLTPLFDADFVLVGPGSPTYAARQLRNSVAWQTVQACQRLGTALILASATTLASSRHVLPVYEIYKVGQDLHWQTGLDLFGAFGLNLVFVPHWNNNDGGDVLDTSHCYIGAARYKEMVRLLPADESADRTIVGIDENTALIIDPGAAMCHVQGVGGVTLVRHGEERRFDTGQCFDAAELGAFRLPVDHAGIDEQLWSTAKRRFSESRAARAKTPSAPDHVVALVGEREVARQDRDWATADRLRGEIEVFGWQLLDTEDGPVLKLQNDSDSK